MQQIVINGNNIDVLKTYPDNYFDSVVTDPPYGLGKEPNAEELMKDWIEKGYHEISGSGFMGKEWDAFVPQPIFWKEVFRVLKYGGHCLAFYGTRTYDWGVMAMRFAGFEVRDCIQWLYGSGFPKSHNISKAIDKMQGAEREVVGEYDPRSKFDNSNREDRAIGGQQVAPSESSKIKITKSSTDAAKRWDGWGSALKPASEYIVMARKPLEKGLSIAENVLKWGTGAINIDGCRVGSELIKGQKAGQGFNNVKGFGVNTKLGNIEAKEYTSEDVNGRFPANLILTHHPECECVGTKKVKGTSGYETEGEDRETKFGQVKSNKITTHYGNEETIENWNCHEDCPIKILDEQSGILNQQGVSKTDNKSGWQNNYVGGNGVNAVPRKLYLDKGGASRFFYVAKASKSERNKGLEDFEPKQMAWSNQAKAELKRGNTEFSDDTKMHNKVQERVNFHPTVKPIKLMQYLVRLVTPPNGIVLDPFVGSGTTGIAAKLEGFNFVGIEQDAEYCKIAQARIENYVEEIQKPTKRKVETDEPVTDEIINTTQLGLF